MKKIFLNFKANKTSPFFWIKVVALIDFLAALSIVTSVLVNVYMNHQMDSFLNEYLTEIIITLGLPLLYFVIFHFLPEKRINLQIVKYFCLIQIPAFNLGFVAYKLGLMLPLFVTYEKQIVDTVKTNLAFNVSWNVGLDSWVAYDASIPFTIDGLGINLFALAIFILTTYKLKKTRR